MNEAQIKMRALLMGGAEVKEVAEAMNCPVRRVYWWAKRYRWPTNAPLSPYVRQAIVASYREGADVEAISHIMRQAPCRVKQVIDDEVQDGGR